MNYRDVPGEIQRKTGCRSVAAAVAPAAGRASIVRVLGRHRAAAGRALGEDGVAALAPCSSARRRPSAHSAGSPSPGHRCERAYSWGTREAIRDANWCSDRWRRRSRTQRGDSRDSARWPSATATRSSASPTAGRGWPTSTPGGPSRPRTSWASWARAAPCWAPRATTSTTPPAGASASSTHDRRAPRRPGRDRRRRHPAHLATGWPSTAAPVVGVPKTLDNDLHRAPTTASASTPRSPSWPSRSTASTRPPRRTTASWSSRRWAASTGWVATMGGLAGGADLIVIPEFPLTMDEIIDHLVTRRSRASRVLHRRGRRGHQPRDPRRHRGQRRPDRGHRRRATGHARRRPVPRGADRRPRRFRGAHHGPRPPPARRQSHRLRPHLGDARRRGRLRGRRRRAPSA